MLSGGVGAPNLQQHRPDTEKTALKITGTRSTRTRQRSCWASSAGRRWSRHPPLMASSRLAPSWPYRCA